MTNSALQTFDFHSASIRVVMIDGEPWFVAKDVARVLEMREAEKLTQRLPEKVKGTFKIGTPGGKQKMLCVNEQGLNMAVLRSNKPEADPFIDWVCGEVLPSIRKTGGYNLEIPGYPQLSRILLLDEPSGWERRFPVQYYQALCEMLGHDYNFDGPHPKLHPIYGNITRKQVYDRAFPEAIVIDLFDRKVDAKKYHQYLKETGLRALEMQIWQVVGIARTSLGYKDFELRCGTAFDNAPLQLAIFGQIL